MRVRVRVILAFLLLYLSCSMFGFVDSARGSQVVVNEFMASNAGSVCDEHGDHDDWIELYNCGDDDVDLAGFYLTDDPANPAQWRFPLADPSVTTIPARGFLLVWADGQVGQGPLHASFKLSAAGEAIVLYDAGRVLLDRVTFGPQDPDVSYGRLPDGGERWLSLATPTPGKSNETGAGRIVISEIMYHPYHSLYGSEDTRREWMELFNAGTASVNLAGWSFSRGVNYTFPDVTLDAGGYLVVAADVATFAAEYAGAGPVVGGWTKRLSNSGEIIELVDETGTRIDRVEYAQGGDWSVRELGPVHFEHRGWIWRQDHDGGGKSLELLNPRLPNEHGQCWAASHVDGGTPGAVNSVHTESVPPLILDVIHSPAIPRSSETVQVTARIVRENSSGVPVMLHYRADGAPDFSAVPMQSDGASEVYAAVIPPQENRTIVEFYVRAEDAGGRSRTWPAPSVVDGESTQMTNALYLVDDSFKGDMPWEPGAKPLYYVIMTSREFTEIQAIGDRNYTGSIFASEAMSDAQMNATFISVDGTGIEVRYRVGVRNRGNQKRANPPMSYRVNFPPDHRWKGVRALNLNSKYPHCELMGSILFQRAGLPAANVRIVRLNVNGAEPALGDQSRTFGFYSAIEPLNSDWADSQFPDDNNGNVYRCTYYNDGTNPRTYADLYYKEKPGETPDPNDYVLNYHKTTNEAANDWSDLFRLIDVLNNRNIPDANLVEAVGEVVNLEKWMRFLAVDAVIGNREGGLSTGIGDDYALYCGANDPRFWLVPHDMDTVLGQGDQAGQPGRDIFSYASVEGLKRLFSHPDVLQLYYQQLRDVIETVFTPQNIDPVIDQFLAGWVPDARINGPQGIKQFLKDRAASILSGATPQIPQRLAISASGPIDPFVYTRNRTVSISGTANAIDTRSVTVNGLPVSPARWSQRNGTWSIENVPLDPGMNRLTVQAFDGRGGTGRELGRIYVDIWSDDGDMTSLAGVLTGDMVLDALSGPWHITGDMVIPSGITLTIEPGVTMFFDPGTGITVQPGGRLLAQGQLFRRIRLTHMPGAAEPWSGIKFDGTLEDNRLCHVDMEFGDGQGESIDVRRSRLLIDHVTWGGTNTTILNMDHPTVIVRDSVFPSIDGTEPIHGVGLAGDECLVFERCVFGTATGYNDVIDFSGAKRPGPVVQIYDCLFLGGSDDGPDLDGADAHIEGCTFTGFHNGQTGDGTSNAIATGRSGSATELWAVRNLFIDNDHAILLKEDSFLHAENNTFLDTSVAVLSFGEPDRNPPRTAGRGAYMAGNIFWNSAAMFEHYFQNPHPTYGPAELAIDASILPEQWHSLGQGNIDADPQFVVSVGTGLKPALALSATSPARGSGSWGMDMGADVPAGAAVWGEPPAVTHRTDATLIVGGPGITHYKYSVNDPNGPWSEERSVDVPIELIGLQHGGQYTVYVLGTNSAGVWRGQPNTSRTWTVDVTHRRLVINEVLAINQTAYEHNGAFPDVVELYYDGPSALSLAGMMLSDDAEQPAKFVFPPGTTMRPGEFLLLFSGAGTSTSGLCLGFGLDRDGDKLYLYDGNGELLDSVEFGSQLPDLSIGRVGYDGHWHLTVPTFGQANVAHLLGDPGRVTINEWLAGGRELFGTDFVELYNDSESPVDLGGFHLTDNPATQPRKWRFPPLSFVAAKGFLSLDADGKDLSGRVDLKLSMEGEFIALLDPELHEIDTVVYGPQTLDVSQGRFPNGADSFTFFLLPTPGESNPRPPKVTIVPVVFVAEDAPKRAIVPGSADQVGDDWKSDVDFDDSAWLSVLGAPGGVGYERSSGYEDLISLDVEEQMYNRRTTCYVRIPFQNPVDAHDPATLHLSVRYDDGFVVWLNGVEVGRASFDGTPRWNSAADANNEAGAAAFDLVLDISNRTDLLRTGDNLLAVQALNVSTTSSDFIISVMLAGTIVEIE